MNILHNINKITAALVASLGAYPSLHTLAGQQSKIQEKYNVLFFIVDDLRTSLGCYGDTYASTPNIDRLASASVIFSNAYCQQAVSNPSRASMLTGLRPDQLRVTNLFTDFRDTRPDVISLPELFLKNGFITVGTGKIFHPVKGTFDPQSWSEPVESYSRSEYLLPENKTQNNGKQGSYEVADVSDEAYPDGKIASDAIRLLSKACQNEQPFFLAVGFKKPHLPFCVPEKYWDIYAETIFKTEHAERPQGSPDLAFHNNQELRGYMDIPNTGPIDSQKEQNLIRGYYACISYVDAQMGKVMDALDSLGQREKTIIVLWGDHGYHLGDQTLWCKSTNFDLSTRVPLIIYSPGAGGAGQSSSALVETVDIYPTLLDLCGITPHQELAGRSLNPLLKKPSSKWQDYAFSQFARPYEAITKNVETHMGYSVRTKEWRYTAWYDLSDGKIVEKELYRMNDNGIERINIAGTKKYAKIEQKLSQIVENYKSGKYKLN